MTKTVNIGLKKMSLTGYLSTAATKCKLDDFNSPVTTELLNFIIDRFWEEKRDFQVWIVSVALVLKNFRTKYEFNMISLKKKKKEEESFQDSI